MEERDDILFTNGVIYSLAKVGDRFSAMGVKGGRITAVGETEELARRPALRRIDLRGKTVVPGFNDSHAHIGLIAKAKAFVELRGARCVEDILDALSDRARDLPPGAWIRGADFDNELLSERRFPTRAELDSVCADHPILISRSCLHAYVANGAALEQAARDACGRSPRLDPDCVHSGLLCDKQADSVVAAADRCCGEINEAALESACREFASHGLTGATSIELGLNARSYRAFQKLAEAGRLPLRISFSTDDLNLLSGPQGADDDYLRKGFYKLVCDGSLGARTAALRERYEDDPACQGELRYSDEDLERLVFAAQERGARIGLHAIGDRCLEQVITVLEKTQRRYEPTDPRFRVIHASLCAPDLLDRLARLSVVIDVQPQFLSADLPWLERRLGRSRARNALNWKTMLSRGLALSAGSDAPVDPPLPLSGVSAAVTRRVVEGRCLGFPEEGWNPAEKLSVHEALSLYTLGSARATREEGLRGSLERGKFADFTVLAQDPFNINPFNIKDIEVEATFLGGALTYARGAFLPEGRVSAAEASHG